MAGLLHDEETYINPDVGDFSYGILMRDRGCAGSNAPCIIKIGMAKH
jgi:hypothetical protein